MSAIPYVGPVDLVGDPQERQHFHGRLHHKKTLFLGLPFTSKRRVSKHSGRPYIRMEYANGLFGSLSMPALEMLLGCRPNTIPTRVLYPIAETACNGLWLAHVESFVVRISSDNSLTLNNRLVDLQSLYGLSLFSEIYGRP